MTSVPRLAVTPGVTILRFISCLNCLVVATTSFCFCPYSLQIMFTHIISFDLHNPPVRFAAMNRMAATFNLPISTDSVLEVFEVLSLQSCNFFFFFSPLKYTSLFFLKESSLQTFCFFSGHRTLYVGVRMPLGRQSHRHHRTHGQKHRRRTRGKGASQGEEGPEALAHGNTSGGRAGRCPQLGGPMRLRACGMDIQQVAFPACFKEEEMPLRIKSICLKTSPFRPPKSMP